jgi:protein phosphatase
MELVKMGNITKEEAAIHPKRNVITRAIGIKDTVETDTTVCPVKTGDIVLLCTDGLCGMLTDEEMAKILNKRTDLEKKAELLIAEANKKGGFDNVSLILVQI